MKKLLLLLILVSCTNKNDYNLILSSDVENNEMAYLVQYTENRPILKDSSQVTRGKFVFNDTISSPEMHYVFFKNLKGSIPVILEPGNIKITFSKDSLSKTKIIGGPSNEDFKKYVSETRIFIEELNIISDEITRNYGTDSLKMDDLGKQFDEMRKKLTDYEFDFMNKNNDSYVSTLILQRMVFERSIEIDSAEVILLKFDKKLSKSNSYKQVKQIITNYKLSNSESPRIGSFAPKFSGPGLNGEVISLSGIKSKYILIDFWASWCAPCRVENPDLADLLNRYSSDDFSILGVSLDMNEQSWKKAIETDGIESWIHISNLKYFNDPIAKLYDISKEGIPSSFLLNEERKIIARNVKSQELVFLLNSELNNR